MVAQGLGIMLAECMGNKEAIKKINEMMKILFELEDLIDKN